MIYYKYKSDTIYTEDIFLKRKVYLSTAEGLNDPFECSLIQLGKDWILEKVKEMNQAGVAGFVIEAKRAMDSQQPFFGLNPMKTEKILENFKELKDINEVAAYRSEVMKKLTGHYPANSEQLFSRLDAQLLSVGIFSLSVNPIHPLMWAHYAGEHSGICLGFEKTENSRLSNPEHMLPVIYSDKLPEMDKNGFNVEMGFSLDENGRLYTSSYKIAFSDSTFQKAITTKPTCWQYEEEWRYVEPYPGEFEWPGKLVEVIFGLKCSEDRRKHYIKLLEENVEYPVSLSEMKKKRGSNQLEIFPLEVPASLPKINSRPAKTIEPKTQMDSKEFGNKMDQLIRQGNYGEVIFQVDENLKSDPNSFFLLSLKGTAHGYAQEHDKALICFTKMAELHPEMSDSWYQMACALSALGRNDEAIEALEKAFEINPNDASTCFNLGVELITKNANIEDALKYLKIADRLGHRRAYGIISEIEGQE
jgi:tetratricopeptide (TPR) repeat protein